ncbi:shikimate kinase [Hippea jasoniae]|uniref:shikimate kinase n=1 Tax=Hippea jasoniae TaxID=944479 RepID=UPI0005518254|nr:shikimate kinase [Hippea jasoniae]
MNITLIGLPSSGKSSVGVILAKLLVMEFIDTDIIIQNRHNQSLQQLVDKLGYDDFIKIEEKAILDLNPSNSVIAPGGSFIYSQKAIEHLKNISTLIYLKISYKEMLTRLGDYSQRGLILPFNQTLKDMYEFRTKKYSEICDLEIENEHITPYDAAVKIKEALDGVK